jgi:hypothetical protein
VGPDPVAAVEGLDVGEHLIADNRLGDEQLQLGAPLGNGREHQLAGVALEHHPSGDGDLVVRLGAGRQVRPFGAHLGHGVGAVEAVRVRLAPRSPDVVDEPLAASPLGRQPAPTGRRVALGGGGVGGRLVHGSPTVQAVAPARSL